MSKNNHEFAGMEEFLVVFCDKHKKGRLFQLELEKYFEKNPLTRENYERIKAAMKHLGSYGVICSRFGIETKKLTPDEYAVEKGISKKQAEKLFEDATKWIARDFCIKLYYMAIQPKHLRRYVFETQFELHNMMKAYDELTDKKTAYEHHVGVCDGPTLGRDLLKEGFDTLEEVQKADRTIIREDGYGLTVRAYAISKALDKYGLKNTLWRGVLRPVPSDPSQGKNSAIYAIEDYGEVKIFFRPKEFIVDTKALRDTLNGLFFNGDCSGFDIDRVTNGDIWVYFNPARHDSYHRNRAISKIAEMLRRGKIFTEELKED